MKAINLPAYMYKEENNGNTKYYAGLERHRPAISVLAYSEKEVREKLGDLYTSLPYCSGTAYAWETPITMRKLFFCIYLTPLAVYVIFKP